MLSAIISSTKNTQHIPVVLKVPNVGSVVVYRVESHRLLVLCCKTNSKSNSSRDTTIASTPYPHTFKFLNCKWNHATDDNKKALSIPNLLYIRGDLTSEMLSRTYLSLHIL